ncbi:MAG: T9SS type A sorting domain-containing protein [Chitinophagaceae bacterium]|nr:T9SS type A sorting domain-containing protein [Chitinophagaceae bacterium]
MLHLAAGAQKTWIGAGAGGSGTDFNTASNWSPSGVPIATDNVIMTLTSSATITLSANASINNLTYTTSGNNVTNILSVGANTLTVNGTTSMTISSGNTNTTQQIGVNGGTSAGVIDFVGNATFSNSTSGGGSGLNGNTNSKFIFRGNLTFGVEAFINVSNIPGTYEFNGTGTQTITWNNTEFYCEMSNVVIGNTNNPTVNQVTGTITPDNILGNLTVNGSSVLNLGTSQWNGGTSAGGTGNAGTLTLNGTSKLQLGAATGGQTGSNFPLRFATLSIGAGSTVEYTGTVAQTVYDIASPGYGNLETTNNSVKTAGAGLDVRGNLIINTTSTFAGSTFSHTVGGNWTNNGTFTQGTSTVTFNGAALQQIGGSTSTTFNNLTLNNTAGNTTTGVSLQTPASVAATLTLTSGHLTTTATNLLTMNAGSTVAGANYATRTSGGSDNSFVNGPLRKTGTTAFLFPLGKVNAGHHFCGISAPVSSSDYTAEYKRASATALGSVSAVGLDHVSNCEYWDISTTAGSPNVNVTLSWNGNSNCNAAVYVNDLASLVAAHFAGTWNSFGGTTDAGSTVSAGSLTWNGVTTFSPFSLGSTQESTNPLPVKLVGIKAWRSGNRNQVEWTNLTETDVLTYETERSLNGTSFTSFSSTNARSNSGDREEYITYDPQTDPVVYYRIKVTGTGGRIVYSPVMKVTGAEQPKQNLIVYPNPVTGNQLNIQLNSIAGDYQVRIFTANGQLVKTETWKHPGGSLSRSMELPAQLKPGQYFIHAAGSEQVFTARFIVQ